MKILLVNDDGIDAPGLNALHETVRTTLTHFPSEQHQIVVVAPHCGRSECGHSVTTGRPLIVEEKQRGWHSVDGTPVDCVRVALGEIFRGADCVLSGINAGANLGVDLLVSGTFAAARESAIYGVPALAISHYRRPDVKKTWDHTTRWLEPVLCEFFEIVRGANNGPHSPPLWNVNLPAIDPLSPTPETRMCEVDPTPMIRSYLQDGDGLIAQSDFHGRPRAPDSDVSLCFSGYLTLSKLSINYW